MRLLPFIAVVGLAACETTMTETTMSEATGDSLMSALSGKTLTRVDNSDLVVLLNSDGTMGGIVEGNWTIRDGQYCRTLTKPEARAGTECQIVTIDGDEATFLTPAGVSTTWKITDT